jgi:hypothetical protein
MKQFILILCCSVTLIFTKAQSPNLNPLFQQISKEKNDSAKFYLVFSGLTLSETNPVDDMSAAEQFVVYGQKHDDKLCEVMGLSCLGYDYRAFGNTAKSLEYNLKAKLAGENSKDDRLLSSVYMGLAANYLDLADYPKATEYSNYALEKENHFEPNIVSILTNITAGEIYLASNKLDSALMYTQKAYEQSMSSGIKYYLCGVYVQLGNIQSKLNNPSLALSYLNLSLDEATKINSPKYINIAENSIAEYYLKAGKKDSAIVYSKKAIAAVTNTAFANMKIKPAKLLLDIYRSTNADSAFKYSEIYRVANDSLYNFKTVQQAQLMTFEEDARQKELAVTNAKQEEQRKENIQYVLISLGIVAFVVLFLLMSRSFIANAKLISFLSIVALLIVFEFLNLLLHPYLEKLTNHTPVFMLFALVCIAALLVPMHHKIEKWTAKKLVEKNKEIRLANARKTIEKLTDPANDAIKTV